MDDVREIKINDHSVTSPEEIAEKFNDYFTSIGPSLAENTVNLLIGLTVVFTFSQ